MLSLLRQLARRCGVLPIELQSRVHVLSVGQIEELGDALLGFVGMVDLVGWLEGYGEWGVGSGGEEGK